MVKPVDYNDVIEFLDYFKGNPYVHISTSAIKRRFRIGSSEAEQLMTRLESDGYVTKWDGRNPRKILK